MPDEQQNGSVTNHKDPTSATSFDEVAKGLASGTVSRGRALRLLGGAVLGGLLTTIPGVAGAEKCKPLGHKCATDVECCSRQCIKNPQGQGKICGSVCTPGQPCGTNSTSGACICSVTVDGNTVCIENAFVGCNACCTADSQCPTGTVCIANVTGISRCIPRCGEPVSASCTSCSVNCPPGGCQLVDNALFCQTGANCPSPSA